MEPSAADFTTHHTFHAGPEDDGLPSWVNQSTRSLTASRNQTDTMHSVLLASGLYIDVDDKLSEIPGRHQANFKATVAWFVTLCFAGIGMFIEAYVIITTGQLKTVWHRQYPTCWEPDSNQFCPNNIECIGLFPNTPDESSGWSPDPTVCDADGAFPSSMLCSENTISAVSYSEFAGIMTGMLVFGMVADVIGRKRAGVLTSTFMIVGIAGMTFFNVSFVNTLFAVWAAFFGIFGTGVGGEYPLSASVAAEQHIGHVDTAKLDNIGQRQQRIRLDLARTLRRGESIALVFSMQGVGAVVGSLVLIALIYFGQQTHVDCSKASSNSSGNNREALNGVWRAFYFIGLLQVLVLLVYRGVISKESSTFEKVKARKQKRKDKHGAQVTWKILGFYAPRLVGTASCWMLWDVGFYGLKLYSGPIFKAFNPDGSLIVNNGLILLNNVVSLVGYYCAAFTIDKKPLGRRRLQMFSFAMCSMIFFITGGIFDTASSVVLMFLFFASSFFGQFGANVTTYV
jgi:MFS family permease